MSAASWSFRFALSGIRPVCTLYPGVSPLPPINRKFLKKLDLQTRFPLKYSIQRSCWLVPDFIGVSRQSRADGFACNRATTRCALPFPSHPEDAKGTSPSGFQAASYRIEMEIAEALAAKGGRTAGKAIGLGMTAETKGHEASKSWANRFSPFALRERTSGN